MDIIDGAPSNICQKTVDALKYPFVHKCFALGRTLDVLEHDNELCELYEQYTKWELFNETKLKCTANNGSTILCWNCNVSEGKIHVTTRVDIRNLE